MKLFYSLVLGLGLLVPSVASAADAVPRDTLATAVNAYFAKDYALADKLLTQLVESGTDDPRVFYYRGLAAKATGKPEKAKADYEAGALLEAEGKGRVDIDRALEKVQGSERLVIQQHRTAAKQGVAKALGGYRKSKALQTEVAQAIVDYQAGRYQKAKDALSAIEADLPHDPRVFYFRGLASFALGDTDAAKADFQRGVKMETAGSNRIDMDKALLKVQGPAREALEVARRDEVAAIKVAKRQREKELIQELVAARMKDSAPAAPVEPAPSIQPNDTPEPTPKPAPKVVAKANPPKAAPTDPVVPPAPPAPPTGASGNGLNFAYLPADAEAIAHIRVKELWNAPLLKALTDSQQARDNLAKMKHEVGFTIADVDSVTFATNSAQAGIAAAATAGPGMPPMPPPFVVVVRTLIDLDPAKLEANAEFEKVEDNGKTHFKSKAGDFAVFIATPRLYVGGSEELVKAAMDAPAEAEPNPNFAFVDASKHIVIAGAPNDIEGLKAMIPDEVGLGLPQLDELAKAVKNSDIKGAALSLNIAKGVQLEVRLGLGDAEQAKTVAKPLGDLVDFGKQTFQLAKATLPPPIASLADKVLSTIKHGASNDAATLSLEVTEATIQEATLALPALLQLAPPGLPIPGLPQQ